MARKEGVKFSKAFWIANVVELLERAAYYGVFIVITLYLSRILGFNDMQAAILAGSFSAGLYFLPTFVGAIADKIGFKQSLLLAFSLLSIGYLGMGILPTLLESAGLVEYTKTTQFNGLRESDYKWIIIPIMIVIMVGGSFIKSCITGTIARETTEKTRAQGYSIFYMMVNIGAFSGKTVVKPLRDAMGNEGLVTLNFFAGGLTLLAIVLVYFFYKASNTQGKGKSFKEIWAALVRVILNIRLLLLIIIITGFWMVQHQLYATMPKYVLRLAGEGSAIEWYANVNPLVVVLTVGLVTKLMSKKTSLFSMTVGMFIMPVSALAMASGNLMGTEPIFGLHPVALMMIVGIIFQGLAETFISPRYLEFFSLQAPKGEEGLYLGFSHLHSFLSSILGFGLSGYLLTKYCPDPLLYASQTEWEAAAVNAHYIWYYFVGIAIISAISLIIYGEVVKRIDAKKQIAN
jgi:dipeptide/tripeptide permease